MESTHAETAAEPIAEVSAPVEVPLRTREQLEQALADANELIGNLRVALTTSRSIGAAVGIVMTVRRESQEQAFEHLRRISQSRHRKLREIAEDVVRTGVVPTG